jgi:hypothetical protein
MGNKVPALPKITLNCVDVRDVALAHVIAMTKPEVTLSLKKRKYDFLRI